MKEASEECIIVDECPRRGNFKYLTTEISHGNGRKVGFHPVCDFSLKCFNQVPGEKQNRKTNGEVLAKLLDNPAVKRIAGHVSGQFPQNLHQSLIYISAASFSTWAHRLHAYYKTTMEKIHQEYPNLRRPFRNSIFPAATFNLGPRTVCLKHLDQANLPFGWCAVTSIGDFDPTKSGHLVLWELKMVIEFPPGSTILIPSACVNHSNVDIGENETRMSFTQYAAGSLFRWVEYGFRSESEFKMLDPMGWDRELEKRKVRWAEGWEMFSKLSEHSR
jgi:hypothetical protein